MRAAPAFCLFLPLFPSLCLFLAASLPVIGHLLSPCKNSHSSWPLPTDTHTHTCRHSFAQQQWGLCVAHRPCFHFIFYCFWTPCMENLIISPSVPEAGFEKIFFVWRLVVKEAGSCTVCVCVISHNAHACRNTPPHDPRTKGCMSSEEPDLSFVFVSAA